MGAKFILVPLQHIGPQLLRANSSMGYHPTPGVAEILLIEHQFLLNPTVTEQRMISATEAALEASGPSVLRPLGRLVRYFDENVRFEAATLGTLQHSELRTSEACWIMRRMLFGVNEGTHGGANGSVTC